ncbi:MAG: autotransporter-associated beta strand repeat-containing protein [Terrimicrobiaceae bacterium]
MKNSPVGSPFTAVGKPRKPAGSFFPAAYADTLSLEAKRGRSSEDFCGSSAHPVLRLACALLTMAVWGAAPSPAGAADAVPYVFKNDTGMSSSQIFIQFLNATSTLTGTYSNVFGDNQQLQANTAYSLDQLTDINGITRVNVSEFSGGRIFVNFGPYGLQGMGPGYTPAAQTSTDPNYSTRYQYFEQTIVPQGTGTAVYTDLSYIDFTAISLSMQAQYSANGTVNTHVQNPNQITANTQLLVDAAYAQSGTNTVAPANPPNPTIPNPDANPAAIIPGGASPNLPNTEFARVISPQFSAAGVYHDFTSYLTSLTGNNTTVRLAGTFVGTGTQPTGNISTQGQTYDFTGTFSGNLTTGGITLTAQPLSGNASVSWLGNSTASGVGNNATIYIPYASLNSQDGIYGNNGNYTITSPGYSTDQVGISNDVWGQVVGDLYAGLSFGYVGSTTMFGNSTIGSLASSQWWASGASNVNGTTIANGTPGGEQILFANTPAGQKIYFSDVQSNPLFYNGYAASLTGGQNPLTTGYGFPLQDRLGNNLLYYNTANASTADTQVLLTINPDGTSALPTGIWSGNATNGQWGTAGNWIGNAVPGGNASVQFVGNHTQTITVDTGGNRSVAGIAFNYAAGNFTIANNTITLTGDVVNSSNKTQTINSNLTLGSNSTVTAAFGDLAFGGAIALKNSATPNTLTFSGTQNSTVSGIISDGNGTGAGGSLVKKGTGTLTLSGNNTFTGGLRHQAGTLVLGNDQAAGTGTLALGLAGAPDAILQAAGGNRTLANALVIAGNTTFSGSNGFVFSGPTTLTGGNITQGNGSVMFKDFVLTNSATVEFGGAIGESVAGSSLTKSGSGTMTFSGNSANTFTGGLAVNDGTLVLAKSSGAAYGGNLTVGDGSGLPGSAVVSLGANNQTPGTNVTIATDGRLALNSSNASASNLTMTGGSVTGNGTLALSNNSTVLFSGLGTSTASISSGVFLNDLSSAGNGTFTFVTNNNAAEVEMVISGPLTGGANTGNSSFTKAGSGTLQLTQNSTFNGTMAVVGGVLASQNLGNSSVSVQGGAMSPGGTGTISAITTGNLYATSGNNTGAFLMDLGGNGTSDSIQAGAIVALGDSTTFLFKAMPEFTGAGNFTLITGTLFNSTNPATFNIVSLGIAGLTGSFNLTGGNLTFSALANQTATWNGGGGSGSWTTAANWNPATVPLAGTDLTFAGGTQTVVSTGGNQTTGAITFASGASAFTINDNTIVLGGNLSNNSSNTQTINSAIALNADRTISANTGNLLLGNVALSNVGALPGVLTIAGAQNTTINGSISDGPAVGGSVVKTGAGTLSLSGNNTFNGTLTISEGTVAANSALALGSGIGPASGSGIDGPNSLIFDGGTLQATGAIVSGLNRSLIMQSTGIIDTNGNNVTINGTIQGLAGLTKNGSGNLTLNQANTDFKNSYLGETTINQGTLVMNSVSVLGARTGGTTVMSNGTLMMNATGNFTVNGEALTLSGTGVAGSGALLLTGSIATWNGTVTLAGDASIQGAAGTKLTLSQTVNVGNHTLTIGSGDALATTSLTSNLTGSGGLTKTGPGTLNLSGNGTGYSGATSIQGGVLNTIGTNSLGSASALTVASGATLQIGIQSQAAQQVSFASISLNGTGVVVSAKNMGAINNNTSNATTVAGDVTLAGNTLINSTTGQLILSGAVDLGSNTLTSSSSSAPIILSGNITGTGGIATTAAGTLQLSGNNSYSGSTTIANSTILSAASANALGSTAGGTTVSAGGTLQFQGGITIGAENLSVEGVGYNGSGALQNLSGNNTFGGAVTLNSQTTLQSNSGTLSLTGALAGSGAQNINIQGPGTIFVAGAVSNVSQVNITSGTFASGNMSSTTISLGPLSGSGTGTPTFSPGNVGTIQSVNISNLITSGNATLLMDLGATGVSDQILTANAPSLSTGISFQFNDLGYAGAGNYTLIHASSGGIGGSASASDITFNAGFIKSGAFTISGPTLTFQTFDSAAVWDVGSGSWGTAGNWQLGGAPVSTGPAGGSAVTFNGTLTAGVDTGTNRSVGDMTFSSNAGAYTLANNTIGIQGHITNNSSQTQTISSSLSLGRNATFSANNGQMVFGGNLSLSDTSTARTLTFAGSNNSTVSGIISNGNATSGAIVKTGAGILTLTGNNTFTGTTTVSTGTLVINGSLASGNNVLVEAGGSLGGSGTIGGQVAVAGTLTPGNSPGTLSTGAEVWMDNGGFNWQLYDASGVAGTGYDTIAITGSLDLSNLTTAGFSINLWTLSAVGPDANGDAINFVATNNYSWTLASTTAGVTGFSATDFAIFTVANNGAAGFDNAFTGVFSVGVSGNDLKLNYTAIPEPATWMLLTGAAIGLLFYRRATRRNLRRDISR